MFSGCYVELEACCNFKWGTAALRILGPWYICFFETWWPISDNVGVVKEWEGRRVELRLGTVVARQVQPPKGGYDSCHTSRRASCVLQGRGANGCLLIMFLSLHRTNVAVMELLQVLQERGLRRRDGLLHDGAGILPVGRDEQ